MILDFGDLYVGSLQFTLKAHSGDEVYIYCFENLFEGAADYTIGLNNGMVENTSLQVFGAVGIRLFW